LRRMGDLARERMSNWTPERNINEFVKAVDRAVAIRAANWTPDTT
jgi:hypothetical protein